ncbi:MAG: M67 family metallopeptidase [Anaerolineales bacterium]|jgi:proteasome lid subunit RPN8/RPN11
MDKLNPLKIFLSRLHFSKILEIAQQQAPLEACGIIAGIDQTSQEIYQITNALYSPVEFLMNPQEMVKVFWEIDLQNLEPIAFFHSHPASQPIPSQTDLDRNYYPETPQLIIGKEMDQWAIRGFLLSKKDIKEIKIEII